ncbi:hypothetical protein [Rhodocaloribacter sp.]
MSRASLSAVFLSILAVALPGLTPRAASAQPRTFAEGPRQAVSVGFFLIDFTFAGDVQPDPVFDFTDPAFGITYARPNVFATFAFGNQSGAAGEDDLRLLDFSLLLWGEVEPFRFEEESRARFFVPVALHSGYRRVSRQGANDNLLDAFEVSVLGLGGGAGFEIRGRNVRVEGRALPVIGLASQSFGGSTGISTLFDADLQVHLGPLANGLGITLGYGFRLQRWNPGGTGLQSGDFFDYSGHQQLFRVGVNW